MLAGIIAPSSGDGLLEGAAPMRGGHKMTTRIQTVFQDPFASLNPRQRIGDSIAEGPIAHGLITRAASGAMVADWLTRVGLDTGFAQRFPHQFSGGQRQRVAIARALAMRRDLGLTCLFISHDLSVVRHVSDRVAIMYLGRIVEQGEAARIYAAPRHPYTGALPDSSPKLGRAKALKPIAGELPSPLAPPAACAFHPRCPLATEICRKDRPVLRACEDGGLIACHHA
jgi:peptide/nickel transport system ATP-binding protein